MKLSNEFESIRVWAAEKGIAAKGDMKTQFLKLSEEAGELAKAINTKDKFETIDAIGDCCVVLTNLATLAAKEFNDDTITVESCINTAYNVIAKRTGKMENGTFVKDK